MRPFLLAATFAGLALAACAMNPPHSSIAPEARAQFAPGGTLRIGVNLGNPVVAQKDPAGGAPRGVGPALGRELAHRLGVPVAYVTYDNAGKMADAVKAGAWDVAFLAVDPARAADIDFTAPYVQIEGTYLVRRDSPLRDAAEVDRPGIRVAVGDKTAYDLFLTRTLRHATLVKAPTSLAAVERFRAEGLDAAAGVKNPLAAEAARDPSLRLVDGAFMVIGQAAGVPRGRPLAAASLREFIEEMKASGFVARALRESGVDDATVAPAAN
jgi:polar amino acid transport system substrate-binding protein